MSLQGFNKEDFETFHIDGLDSRMEAIQNRIQPKFQLIGSQLVDILSAELGNEMFLHIAKHARRTVNPPQDTWLAIGNNKRGYKKHPHFQLGLFDDHLFVWLAFIYELPNKEKIAQSFINQFEDLKKLPNDYVISLDHTKKESFPITELDIKHLERFRDVKKGEFLIGKHLSPDDERVRNGEKLFKFTKETYEDLIPFYQSSLQTH
ncbi:YktB family protein [Oceanobacillus caeni]